MWSICFYRFLIESSYVSRRVHVRLLFDPRERFPCHHPIQRRFRRAKRQKVPDYKQRYIVGKSENLIKKHGKCQF